MRTIKMLLVFLGMIIFLQATAQVDSLVREQDSINQVVMLDYQKKLLEFEQQRKTDSLKRIELENKLSSLTAADKIKEVELQSQLQEIADREARENTQKRARIDSLRKQASGFPVFGMLKDTLFLIYAKSGALSPYERAQNISRKIRTLYRNDFLEVDSIVFVKSENSLDIVYDQLIVMSLTETDAMWENKSLVELADEYTSIIRNAILLAKKEFSLSNLLIRIGLVALILLSLWFFVWVIGKLYHRLIRFVDTRKDKWLKNLSYKDYTFLSADQEIMIIFFIFKVVRWFFIAIVFYIAFPLIFSVFAFTRGWADDLVNLVWSPFKSIFIAIWEYLPNLFSILAIYFVMKYFIRLVKYFFAEIDSGKLKINGFHADWSMPTYSIVKFLLYAFMFILIFPYLPGSDSNIFKGVSVFLGVLFSLGSSSAIANMVAGLVITYMRPFKIGDRIKIGDITGDVVEKTLLVTRLRTIKNEEITIPNSSVLSGNTTNYSAFSKTDGLIIHSKVTIGYDVPWKEMHQALIDAALLTDKILSDPKPFVLQISLDDFYITYQLNAYIREANIQSAIYSMLHQNIQDVCNQRGIEIMSPHYRSQRDGNRTTIPSGYLSDGYVSPCFRVDHENERDE
ncbi:MAG: transmembrane ion channel [Bacteroidetes bacterium GWF2_41_31]|nr:MAG: transmembrane ion channel [Bacteroidetes bacterium GWF2_41_31]